MLILKINGKVHYINMRHVIEIYEETDDDDETLKIRLVDGAILTITRKEEIEAVHHFLEGHFEGGEA